MVVNRPSWTTSRASTNRERTDEPCSPYTSALPRFGRAPDQVGRCADADRPEAAPTQATTARLGHRLQYLLRARPCPVVRVADRVEHPSKAAHLPEVAAVLYRGLVGAEGDG